MSTFTNRMAGRISLSLLFCAAMAACGGGDSSNGAGGTGGGPASAGAGGGGGSGGRGGSSGTGGQSGTGGGGSGGASGAGGGSAGTGGAPKPDAGKSDKGASGDGASKGDGGVAAPGGGAGSRIAWYEAEAVPPNQLIGRATVGNCGAGTCPSIEAIKEGLECCSGGKKVSQVIRGTAQLQFNGVEVPSDGTYDVTWWFHCGKNDNFGDKDCGGQPTRTASGCRPHVFVVNDVKLDGVYHFPCFPGSWGEIHASTVPLPLKAGKNSIRVFATPGRDAADLDAIAIYPAGMGTPPLIPKSTR
jgi:hypothetical protein